MQTKIGCVKSFAVKCAHKCNFLRINATFVENKCNFLTFLLQQKLALVIMHSYVIVFMYNICATLSFHFQVERVLSKTCLIQNQVNSKVQEMRKKITQH